MTLRSEAKVSDKQLKMVLLTKIFHIFTLKLIVTQVQLENNPSTWL